MLLVLISRHKDIEGRYWGILWLQVTGLHTLDGLFCFLGFRLDLCFEPLDFVLFEEGKGKVGMRVSAKSDGRWGRTREGSTEEQRNKGWRRATPGCRWWERKKTVRQVNEERQARATSRSHTDDDEVRTVEEEHLHPSRLILWQRRTYIFSLTFTKNI